MAGGGGRGLRAFGVLGEKFALYEATSIFKGDSDRASGKGHNVPNLSHQLALDFGQFSEHLWDEGLVKGLKRKVQPTLAT